MCRWESGLLKVRISLINFVAILKAICTANELQELQQTNQSGVLTARRLISVVQTVWVAVTFKALGDAVPTAALEVTGMTSPQLYSNRQTEDKAHRFFFFFFSLHSQRGEFCHDFTKETFSKLGNIAYPKQCTSALST